MRLTEQQLYNMICESINDVLKEAEEENQTQYPDIHGNFTEKGPRSGLRRFIDKARHMAYGQKGGFLKGLAGAATQAGASFGLGTTSSHAVTKAGGGAIKSLHQLATGEQNPNQNAALDAMSQNLAEGTTSFLAWLGVAGALYGLQIRARALNQLANTNETPDSPEVAINCFKTAGTERLAIQKTCLVTQTTVKNTIQAYNLVFPDNQINIKQIFENVKQTCNEVGNEGMLPASMLDVNFTNRYAEPVSESTDTQIKSVGEIIKKFKELNDHQKSFDVVEETMRAFIKSAAIWYKWSMYIEAIKTKFPTLKLNTQNAIDGGQRAFPGATLLAGHTTGYTGIGKAVSAVGRFAIPVPKAKSKDQGNFTNITVRVINTNYNHQLNKNETLSGVLVQQERTNNYFLLPNQNIELANNMSATLTYHNSYVKKMVQTPNEGKIYCMTAQTKITPINYN